MLPGFDLERIRSRYLTYASLFASRKIRSKGSDGSRAARLEMVVSMFWTGRDPNGKKAGEEGGGQVAARTTLLRRRA